MQLFKISFGNTSLFKQVPTPVSFTMVYPLVGTTCIVTLEVQAKYHLLGFMNTITFFTVSLMSTTDTNMYIPLLQSLCWGASTAVDKLRLVPMYVVANYVMENTADM